MVPTVVGFGVDVGGTGVKAAPVDLSTGRLAAERHRLDTPRPATPERVADTVAHLVRHHGWDGPVGVCVPAIVRHGVVGSAANIDAGWIGTDAVALFEAHLDRPVRVVNDADAAGLAEMTWGVGRDRTGVVVCVTFGTGIGSAVFVDGVLVPNTELGHLQLDGRDAEASAAAKVRERDDLSWAEWADRAARYLRHLVGLFSPDLIVVGGGVSNKADRWLPDLERSGPIGCEVAVAGLANSAGIAGAALLSAG